jgi:predicted NAD-dependent protein-ADP-ribosyltransferase YbiA (DUF1768 family)
MDVKEYYNVGDKQTKYLSNTYLGSFYFYGVKFLSTRHYYLYRKFHMAADKAHGKVAEVLKEVAHEIRRTKSSIQCAEINEDSKNLALLSSVSGFRKKWASEKVEVMKQGLAAKFREPKNRKFRDQLVQTNEDYIAFGGRTKDVGQAFDAFLGFDSAKPSENKLGELMMELRDELSFEKPSKYEEADDDSEDSDESGDEFDG